VRALEGDIGGLKGDESKRKKSFPIQSNSQKTTSYVVQRGERTANSEKKSRRNRLLITEFV